MKKDIDSDTTVVGGFNTALSLYYRSTKLKYSREILIFKEVEEINLANVHVGL